MLPFDDVIMSHLNGIGFPIINVRRSDILLIFIMGISIPGKTVFILGRSPGIFQRSSHISSLAMKYTFFRCICTINGYPGFACHI